MSSFEPEGSVELFFRHCWVKIVRRKFVERFDREAANWDEDPKKVRLANEIADAMLEELKPAPETDVLEFGCGTGLVTLRLQPVVRSIVGVDSSAAMLGQLEAKVAERGLANVAWQQIDLEKGGQLEGSFDLVASSMTLHHIRDLDPLLVQFFRVLRPGGRVALADLDQEDGKFHDNPEGVFHMGFDRETLRSRIEKAGFVAVHDRLATEFVKPVDGGAQRGFSVFLMSARKPE